MSAAFIRRTRGASDQDCSGGTFEACGNCGTIVAQHAGFVLRSLKVVSMHCIERLGDQRGDDSLAKRIRLHQGILKMLAKPLIGI